MAERIRSGVRAITGSAVRTNRETGLSRFQFDIGAPEEINLMGTGKRKCYCLSAFPMQLISMTQQIFCFHENITRL